MTEADRNSAIRRFFSDRGARFGIAGLLFLFLPALTAPLLANGRPLLMLTGNGELSAPFLEFFFAPDAPEYHVEQLFNFLLLFLPGFFLNRHFFRKKKRFLLLLTILWAAFCLTPFLLAQRRIDKLDYRQLPGKRMLFAPIPYGPFELSGTPYAPPDRRHVLGCDEIGRDVASRLIYGARISLAVGVIATMLTVVIGTTVGLLAGFYRGWFDLTVMRLVEILLCFPTFLLLLILMSILRDRQFDEFLWVVISVIGLTGWIGLAFLVRGETLKQSALPYLQSGIVSGIPVWRLLAIHLLPNIAAPILVSFTFGIAGAIALENGLSFLGFGVQPPTASWGGLLRQAFDNPLNYWHLTFFPGLILFIAILSFNFLGEGLRKAMVVK